MLVRVINLMFSDIVDIDINYVCTFEEVLSKTLEKYLFPENHCYKDGKILFGNIEYTCGDTLCLKNTVEKPILILMLRPGENLTKTLDRIPEHFSNYPTVSPYEISASYATRYFRENINYEAAFDISNRNVPQVFDIVKDKFQIPDIDFLSSRMARWIVDNIDENKRINAVIDWIATSNKYTSISPAAVIILLSLSEPKRSLLFALYISIGRYYPGDNLLGMTQGELLHMKGETTLSDDAENAICGFPHRPIDIIISACIYKESEKSFNDITEIIENYINGNKIFLGSYLFRKQLINRIGENWPMVDAWVKIHNSEAGF